MPIVFYCLTIVLIIASLRINHKDCFLDKNSSNTIKGFFVLMIVLWHILKSFHYDGFLSSQLGSFLQISGQLIVSMFFFISGYGIIYSVEQNGVIYSKSIITNRFLRILPYSISSLIPYFIYSACLSKPHSFQDYLLSVIGLSSFGNVNWFLFVILLCYFLCSIVYLFKWRNKYIPIVLIAAGIVAYFLFMLLFKRDLTYWYDTVICFPLGMFAALYKDKINSVLSKNKAIPITFMVMSLAEIVLMAVIVKAIVGYYEPNAFIMIPNNICLCLFFVCLTKLFTLKSPVLEYLGKASFAIFFMHMFVINCFIDIGTIPNEHLNYLVLFIASAAIGIPFYYIYKLVDKYITNPIVEWNRSLIKENK